MKFHLNIINMKVVKYWKSMLKEVVNSPSLEILKTQLGCSPENLLWLTLT